MICGRFTETKRFYTVEKLPVTLPGNLTRPVLSSFIVTSMGSRWSLNEWTDNKTMNPICLTIFVSFSPAEREWWHTASLQEEDLIEYEQFLHIIFVLWWWKRTLLRSSFSSVHSWHKDGLLRPDAGQILYPICMLHFLRGISEGLIIGCSWHIKSWFADL